MTEKEYLAKFDADFQKLKHNREKVPLEELRTRYAKSYEALLDDVRANADWWIDTYIRTVGFTVAKDDDAGVAALRKRIETILEEERKPGGLFTQAYAALIDQLDETAFQQKAWEIYHALDTDAYDAYFQRFNQYPADGSRIYNSLIKAFWDPAPARYDQPCWVDKDGLYRSDEHPPIQRKDLVQWMKTSFDAAL